MMTDALHEERFYDRDRKREVEGRVEQTIQFKMKPGEQCTARGVMRMDDGTVYTWTIFTPRYRDVDTGRRRLATLSRQPFKETALGLLAFEEDQIEPDLLDECRKTVDAL